MPQTEVLIERARSHNLRGVTCRIPLRQLTVVTGVSGCGKSTLAFDTLYAEGQRRYVCSLSTYARQFLEQLARPEVDQISNLPPAIAIEQRNAVTNARSTVGTATELLDSLRLLYAAIGITVCPDCERPVEVGNAHSIADAMERDWAEEAFSIGVPLTVAPGADPKPLRERLAREGFSRLLMPDGAARELDDVDDEGLLGRGGSPALILLDRLSPGGEGVRARILEAIALGFSTGARELEAIGREGGRQRYWEGLVCGGCGQSFATPEPRLFSFNNPLGACATCQGFGRVSGISWERVVPKPALSLEEDAIVPFSTPMGRELRSELLAACHARGIPTDAPFADLSPAQREFVFEGDFDEVDGWIGVRGFFDWLEGRRYKVQSRVLLARYRRYDPCPDCRGMRLCADALAVRVVGRNLGELSRLTLGELRDWLGGLELEPGDAARAERLLEVLRRRLDTAVKVGLDYMPLDRQLRTLSGGEAQRIQLATALGGGLTAALYVLDEPTVGLHPRDMSRLLGVVESIRDQGNTVVVVEHASEIVAAADHVIDLGPGAGMRGGELVFEGPVADLRRHPDSLTGKALRGELSVGHRARRDRTGALRIVGARENNLRDLDVEIPLGQLVAVTGVSGAGKSTLILSVLVGNLVEPSKDTVPGACDAIEGTAQIGEIVVVDQRPASRSPRSNPATVSKAFEGIRRRFAATREARALGLGPGWFSFNVAGGRCDGCEGAGEVVIDMQFLDDLRVPCDDCSGTRYRREVLDIRVDGHSIVDVLAMTIDEASAVFVGDTKIASRLAPLCKVGLGYLTLGQPLSTLSGGENQRLRLARALTDAPPSALYILDEPTTGLHPADVRVLVRCLDELIDGGGSVIVVEHNLEVIEQCDYVIDLGPEGGPGGGALVAAGTPEEVAKVAGSITGAALRGEFRGGA